MKGFMMMSQSIFNTIKKQLVNNELYGNKRVLEITNEYPENIIVWLTTKQKAFKVVKVNKTVKGNRKHFEIEYKDVYTGCDFINDAYETAKARLDRAIRKGYLTVETKAYNDNSTSTRFVENNESVTNKFNHLADIYRDELECPNWSGEYDETGYQQCPFNTRGYEMLDKADDCTFDIYLQQIGYENYYDFYKKHELSTNEFMDIFINEYNKFRENNLSKEYQY